MSELKGNILLVDPFQKDSKAVNRIVGVIRDGGVVVMPWGVKRREAFVMLADATRPDVVKQLNKIKDRPEDQPLGVTLPSHIIPNFADLQQTKAVQILSRKLGITPEEYINALFSKGALAVIVNANDKLSAPLVESKGGEKTIMFATEMQNPGEQVIHDVYDQLWKYGIVMGGTSANGLPRSDQNKATTLTIDQQQEAIEFLGPKVDLVVGYNGQRLGHPERLRRLPEFLKPVHFGSSTYFDLTQYPPALKRAGSVHPSQFSEFIPHYVHHPEFKNEPLRETRLHVYTDPLMQRLVA